MLILKSVEVTVKTTWSNYLKSLRIFWPQIRTLLHFKYSFGLDEWLLHWCWGFMMEFLTQRTGSVMTQITATTSAKSLWHLLIIQYLEDPLSSLIVTQDSELRTWFWRINNPNQVKARVTWSDLTGNPHDFPEVLSNSVLLWSCELDRLRKLEIIFFSKLIHVTFPSNKADFLADSIILTS